jgi:hypothetical protein
MTQTQTRPNQFRPALCCQSPGHEHSWRHDFCFQPFCSWTTMSSTTRQETQGLRGCQGSSSIFLLLGWMDSGGSQPCVTRLSVWPKLKHPHSTISQWKQRMIGWAPGGSGLVALPWLDRLCCYSYKTAPHLGKSSLALMLRQVGPKQPVFSLCLNWWFQSWGYRITWGHFKMYPCLRPVKIKQTPISGNI